ncbi:Fic family protein [Francisella tularensis subsp. novicida]|uniref:Fic family protein n=1 Tax=Francisella tularensis TaxID=263 RepID=UPI000503D03B|nr:Fic family protein [Francisella tularensis]AJJ47669.1 fic/DOC family protein [Francisella tularensis subsp. novicida]AJJ48175.1 fic/DOC family protein [Francisella tularensis subsp. novicida]AJJ48309.1 fic/DOC family protein [Francisella tularensis subsp. novicida]KFJ66859.1 fic/DOC family protein [Francisella tularensis subsp. novicida]MBK2345212.1 Fic family protein [Francisella tularensis subsp. novicida]
MKYQPPYTITPKIISLVADISQEIGKITATSQIERDLRLRKINQVKTIRGTLAIEGNTLDESHITAILEGKRILAPQKEILEIRNAIKTYDKFQILNYKEEKDLLSTHLTLMQGLVDEVGVYRSGSVGVMEGNNVIHLAPPAKKLRELMKNLFDWIANTEEHPIISSCVFHYEFEFIHPFADGNGRMGRLWQSLILSHWNKLFSYIPVESIVYEHQKAYYEAIQESTNKTDCYPFIEFMLEMLSIAIREITPQVEQQVSPQVKKLIEVLKDKELTRQELQDKLKLKDRKSFVERYLKPALEQKLIEMTIPDKPNSKSQKYRMARP